MANCLQLQEIELSVFMTVNEQAAREYLSAHNWPAGLQECFLDTINEFPLRFFICDDSGSMATNDGSRIIVGEDPTAMRSVRCSRWTELGESMKFHAGLARSACCPTEFRLLNGIRPLCIGTGGEADQHNYAALMEAFAKSPAGGTPLCTHIKQVIDKVRAIEAKLRETGKKANITIATDGEATDGKLADALKPLKFLPVAICLRLCTDEQRIVDYWNKLDQGLELHMDVIDDFTSEAKQVMDLNPCLTYGLPLQLIREFGVHHRELDMLDEITLNNEQIRKTCQIIYGGALSDYPHPDVDLAAFLSTIQQRNTVHTPTYHPVKDRLCPWIDETAVTSDPTNQTNLAIPRKRSAAQKSHCIIC